ncbi:DUF4007 family protein [Streptomyces longwoodensis]|uniref:DUF4007 family protein n=1 Tax=Streptomyces TaxID=1883 RepID=UPI002F90F07A|nr:DUF4007 family protein [Streptomyces longwoodensis]
MSNRTPLTGFGRHRGYPPRYGWLRKVYDALRQDPTALRRPDATVVLGVGKSMVPSMAFWSQAFGLAVRNDQDLVPTNRAHWLLDEDTGADPYLELDASLWLLHWWLVSSEPCHVPTWRYLFGYSPFSRSSRAELQGRLAAAADAAGHRTPAASVLASDIACLVSMYAPGAPTAANIEDELSNPFRTLHLLDPEPPADRTADRSHLVALRRLAGRHCPAPVQAYASLDFAARTASPAAGSISLARLASDPLGPADSFSPVPPTSAVPCTKSRTGMRIWLSCSPATARSLSSTRARPSSSPRTSWPAPIPPCGRPPAVLRRRGVLGPCPDGLRVPAGADRSDEHKHCC